MYYTGLYYDGNRGIWYTYDHQKQEYVPCTDQRESSSGKDSEFPKTSEASSNKKVVISAPAATITSVEKAASLPDAVQAAATAAIAAEKREKEKAKEIKLASKSSILANKKKMNNVLTMWKQRSHEGQATRVALDDNQLLASTEDKSYPVGQSMKSKPKADVQTSRESTSFNSGAASTGAPESQVKPRPVSNSSGGTLMGVIRGSGRGIIKSDSLYSTSSNVVSTSTVLDGAANPTLSMTVDTPSIVSSFRTDASALGSYTPPATSASGKRRFSEMPQGPQPSASANREQPQTAYRDRAAERRSLYGSSTFVGDDRSNLEFGDLSKSCLIYTFHGCHFIILAPLFSVDIHLIIKCYRMFPRNQIIFGIITLDTFRFIFFMISAGICQIVV